MSIRNATARWTGTLTEGTGVMRTGKGGYEGAYSFKSRFEEGEGTNPEELTGAAHAGCFSMFLSKLLAEAGHPPTAIETSAKVRLERKDEGPAITRIELDTAGEVPGMVAAEVNKHVGRAAMHCPVA